MTYVESGDNFSKWCLYELLVLDFRQSWPVINVSSRATTSLQIVGIDAWPGSEPPENWVQHAFNALCIDLFERAFFGDAGGSDKLKSEFYLLSMLASMLYVPQLLDSFGAPANSPARQALASIDSRWSHRDDSGSYKFGEQFRSLITGTLSGASVDRTYYLGVVAYFLNALKKIASRRTASVKELTNSRLNTRQLRGGDVANRVDFELIIRLRESFDGLPAFDFRDASIRQSLLEESYFLPIFALMVNMSHNDKELRNESTEFNDRYLASRPNPWLYNPLMMNVRTFARVLSTMPAGSFDQNRFVTKFSGAPWEKLLMTSTNSFAATMRYCFDGKRTIDTRSQAAGTYYPLVYSANTSTGELRYKYGLQTARFDTPDTDSYKASWLLAKQRATELYERVPNILQSYDEEEQRERSFLKTLIIRYNLLSTTLGGLANKIERGEEYPALRSLMTLARAGDGQSKNVLCNISPNNTQQIKTVLDSRVASFEAIENPVATRFSSESGYETSTIPGATVGSAGDFSVRALAFASLCMTNRFIRQTDRNVVFSIGLPNRFVETLTQRSVRFATGKIGKTRDDSSRDVSFNRKLVSLSAASFGIYAPLVIVKRDERVPYSDYVLLDSPLMLPVNLRVGSLVPRSATLTSNTNFQQVLDAYFEGSRPLTIHDVALQAFSSIRLDMFDPRTGSIVSQVEYGDLLSRIQTSAYLASRNVRSPFDIQRSKKRTMAKALSDGLGRFLESEFISYGIEMLSGIDMRDVSMLGGSSQPRVASYPLGSSTLVASILRSTGMLDYLGVSESFVVNMFEPVTTFGVSMERLKSPEVRSRNSIERSATLMIQSVLAYLTQHRDRYVAVSPKVYDRCFHLNLDTLDFGQKSLAIKNLVQLDNDTEKRINVFTKPSGEQGKMIKYDKNDIVNQYTMDEYWAYVDLDQLFVG